MAALAWFRGINFKGASRVCAGPKISRTLVINLHCIRNLHCRQNAGATSRFASSSSLWTVRRTETSARRDGPKNSLSSAWLVQYRLNSTVVPGSLVHTVVASNVTSPMPLDAALDLSTTATDSLATTLSAAAGSEPTLASLGLGGWAPSGWVQSVLEAIHVTLDVPWWGAIVIGTVCVRLAIFPLVILAQRNAAMMHNHMPTITRLQEKMTVARGSGDAIEAMKASRELTDYMLRNNVNPFKNLLPPLAQAPIFMSVFFGLRGMAALPVESMKSGGIMWFTDLTVPDPFYAMPVLTMVTLLATIEVGVDGIKADQMQTNVKYLLRAMPFICFPFIIQFPSALLCYWFTSNAFSLVQVLMLKIPGVKPFFRIPVTIDHGLAKNIRPSNVQKKSFMEGFKETMRNAQLAAEIEERQRYNALQLKKSNRSPLTQHASKTATSKPTQTETENRTADKSQPR